MKMPPLLVRYPNYRDSQASSSGREPMAADADVLGFGIVFPGKPGSGTVYVQADIPPLETEEDYDGANAIPEELNDRASRSTASATMVGARKEHRRRPRITDRTAAHCSPHPRGPPSPCQRNSRQPQSLGPPP